MRKGSKGRHYKAEAERKTAGIYCRFTAETAEMIRRKAEAAGIPVSEFIARACASKRVEGYQKPQKAKKENPAKDIPGQLSLNDLSADACDADAEGEAHEDSSDLY